MLKQYMRRISEEEEIYEMNKNKAIERPILREIHIADIHFGVMDAKLQYEILDTQFLQKIENTMFDILSIDGDLFDHKVMTNSPVVTYATMFVSRCINRCKQINATMVIIDGTDSHDSGQLSIFYHYLNDPEIDLRIVTKVQFEYIKGAKILCIPEMYNMGREYYEQYLKSGLYDSVFMHGMIKGAVYQEDNYDLDSYKAPIFDLTDFNLCLGPIISGHVHIPGCFKRYMYYTGSPLRFRHGEEQQKGFIILLHDLNTHDHYVHFEPIQSFKYITIYLDDIIKQDPKVICDFIKNKKESENIDNIRIKFNKPLSEEDINNLSILRGYFRNKSDVNFDYKSKKILEEKKMSDELNDKYLEYQFLFDDRLSFIEKFVMYVNKKEQSEFITVEEFQKILDTEI